VNSPNHDIKDINIVNVERIDKGLIKMDKKVRVKSLDK